MGKTLYEHDCKNCVLLAKQVALPGRDYRTNETYDMYVCPSSRGAKFDSLIARYGNRGEEYYSISPTDVIMCAYSGLLQGLWAQYHDVRTAGSGFVTIKTGERVYFR